MDLGKLASLPARFKPWRPRHARLIARDLLGTSGQKEYSNRIHATAAIDWLWNFAVPDPLVSGAKPG